MSESAVVSAEVQSAVLSPERRSRAMRAAVLTQCAGAIGSLAFTNGLLLLYLQALGMGSLGVMVALALHEGGKILLIPIAHGADRYGIKKLGLPGLWLTVVAYTLLAVAGWFESGKVWALLGIVGYAVGNSVFAAGWFALLAGFVPEELRGRFFGVLRFSWQIVVILFVSFCSYMLSSESPMWVFQLTIGLVAVGQLTRVYFYSSVPEVVAAPPHRQPLLPALIKVMRLPQYLPFCSYVFLLSLFTAATPIFFGIVETNVLSLGDRRVMLLGAATLVGSLVGFGVSGFAVDRLGTKMVFLMCHFGFAAILASYPFRHLWPLGLIPCLGLLHFGFGMAYAASSVSISTEMLNLVPSEGKSLSTALCLTLQSGGIVLSSLLAAGAIAIGFFKPQWILAGTTVSNYDAILLIYASMVCLLTVTLGLVPSVVRQSRWIPRDQ